jgi:hypothetical protein
MHFTVPPFGWTSSPYFTLRMLARVIELSKGPRYDTTSPFHWEKVVINLPSSKGYKPMMPRVMLIRPDGLTAAGCLACFDDGRIYGHNKPIAQQALHHICAKVQWCGNQEAARKRRPCQLRPDAWYGGVVYADQELPCSFLTQKHWDRLIMTFEWMFIQAERNGAVPRRSILEKRGFLVFASMAYPFMVPYLKSLQNSVEEWRLNRDKDGYAIEDQLLFH